MDDMLVLTIVLGAQASAFIIAMLYMIWKPTKEEKERELKDFIAESFEGWPVETALNDWLKTATSKGQAKYVLEDWLKTALGSWKVKEALREQINDIVEAEVRKQLLEARLKAA